MARLINTAGVEVTIADDAESLARLTQMGYKLIESEAESDGEPDPIKPAAKPATKTPAKAGTKAPAKPAVTDNPFNE